MKCLTTVIVFLCIFLIPVQVLRIDAASTQAMEQKQDSQKRSNEPKLLDRIDFGDSHILGQTIKSGAVYLLQRKKSEIKSMLKYREGYREEILEDFYVLDAKGEKIENK